MNLAPRRRNAAWLQTTSTDPKFHINREEQLEELVGRLDEFRQAKIHEGHFLITGARGIGKSIFTRTALARFAALQQQAICITIDARGLGYRSFLQRIAEQLARELGSRAAQGNRNELTLWAQQLLLLAKNPQISRALSQTVTQKYGAGAKAGADLLYKLEGSFTWEETRSIGSTVQTSLTVTDELLHSATCATLERLRDEPWIVVVFFDDLDQALVSDSETEVAALFRKVLDLRPCISLVHFRTESMVENVGREVGEKISLSPLDSEHLFELLLRRLQDATEEVRRQFPPAEDPSWSAIRRLSKLTGNPFVFLQWVHGLLRTQTWPAPDDWHTENNLGRIANESPLFTGVDPALLVRLMKIVDRFSASQTMDKNALLRGVPLVETGAAEVLSSDEIDMLVRFNILLPRVRFQPEMGYRTQPVLDLLRPSVQRGL